MLASTTALSQFFRSSTSVIGPELIRDLALSSEALGFANGAFFMAVFLAQIPVGIAFDRFGVRLTVAVLSVPMAAGAMLHGVADTGMQLAAARFLVGLGCAASYTAGIVVISRWFASTVLEHADQLAVRPGPDRPGAGGHAAGGRRRVGWLALPVRGHGPRRHARRLPVPAGRARSIRRVAATGRPGAGDEGRRVRRACARCSRRRAGAGVLPVHGRLRRRW